MLFALLLIAGLSLGGWLLVRVDAAVLARLLRGIAIGVLGVLALFLALRGLAVLDLPVGGLIIYLLNQWLARGFPGVARLKAFVAGRRPPAPGSTVETAMLRMTLDTVSGALGGEVLAGQFAGAQLAQLSLVQLRALLGECDEPSERLLVTYLDRVHPDWRESGASRTGAMTREEALQVLGLGREADAAQVRQAHRRLMAKLHPDHGGSDYLASQINAARDVLLK